MASIFCDEREKGETAGVQLQRRDAARKGGWRTREGSNSGGKGLKGHKIFLSISEMFSDQSPDMPEKERAGLPSTALRPSGGGQVAWLHLAIPPSAVGGGGSDQCESISFGAPEKGRIANQRGSNDTAGPVQLA